jgi:hypothetical protein
METVAIDSKDQNRINIFQATAYDVSEYEQGSSGYQTARATMRLAYYNMSLEAQAVAYNWYIETISPVWMSI